jgi:hypothetical protein
MADFVKAAADVAFHYPRRRDFARKYSKALFYRISR